MKIKPRTVCFTGKAYTVEGFEKALIASPFRGTTIPIDGKYQLSIVFGRTAYSTPQENLNNVLEYTEFEVALVDDISFVQPRNVSGIESREWVDYFEEFGCNPIASFVPKETVVQMVNDIVARKNFGG
jgi:hypothetical protein